MVFRLKPITVSPTHQSSFRNKCHKIVTSKYFEYTIYVLIVINVTFMSIEYYGEPNYFQLMQDLNNLIFTMIYAFEALIKIYAYTWKVYIKSGWNKFDLFLVIMSLFDLSVFYLMETFQQLERLRAIQKILRMLRIARMFKLVRGLKGIRSLLATLIISLPAFWNVGALILLIFFVYAYTGNSK